MPFTTFDDSVSGQGSASLSGSRVLYVAWEVTTAGPSVHAPNHWDTDALLGVGHFELGNDLTGGGLISGVGYDKPHWFNWATGQWVVKPTVIASDIPAIFADHIRWTIESGSVVHLVVFGDS